MTILNYILFTFLFILVATGGCDSPTETRAISITPPSLISPPDNATGVSLTPTFTWRGNADKLAIATNSNFDGAMTYEVSGESFTLTNPLAPNTVYFWKAGITSGSGVYWSSSIYRFTTSN